MVPAPAKELLEHETWNCFRCKYTACYVCFPPKFKYTYKSCHGKYQAYLRWNYPVCDRGQCVHREKYKISVPAYACSEKCSQWVKNYCLFPYRYHKQNFRLQVQRMLNNWQGTSSKTRMKDDEHSYTDVYYPDTEVEEYIDDDDDSSSDSSSDSDTDASL